jgi:uncharacterized protein (DUF924 family)
MLFEKLYQQTPSDLKPVAQNFLKYAKEHREIIKRFKRFPHRNQILGRASTKDEIEFLKIHQGY